MLKKQRTTILVLVLLVVSSLQLMAQGSVSKPDGGTSRGGLMLFGGLGMPAGDFKKTDRSDGAGYAKTGWFGGAELMFSVAPSVGIVLDGRYFQNKLDDSQIMTQIGNYPGISVSVGSWTGILPMGGIRLYTTGAIGLFIDGQAGYMFARSPSVSVTGSGVDEKVDAVSGKGLAYGGSAGIDIGNTLIIGASYIMSKPKFDMTDPSSGQSTTMEHPMNMIHVFAGIRF